MITGSGNALAKQITQYFVFPVKRMKPEVKVDASKGISGTISERGWSNADIFQNYLQNHFLKCAVQWPYITCVITFN